MHQYTSDLANRMAVAGDEVHLVTTTRVPRDRYLAAWAALIDAWNPIKPLDG